MTLRALLQAAVAWESLNFLLTNRVPRRLLTRFVGWFGRIEQPLVRDLSIGAWRLFADIDLRDAKRGRFTSLHDLFTRELREGARPVDQDPSALVSPCDAIVGACGPVRGVDVFQIKGLPYGLPDLIGDAALVERFRDGCYATLRLTSGMYHRFHAPHDIVVEAVTYISGDTWNVNPAALRRVDKLFCLNERAVIRARLEGSGAPILLVPVAAILVASIRLSFLDVPGHLRDGGGRTISCDARFRKGEEMGWFEHGSTIIVLAPAGFSLGGAAAEGAEMRVGRPLMRLP